jgi:hypothetical protein
MIAQPIQDKPMRNIYLPITFGYILLTQEIMNAIFKVVNKPPADNKYNLEL